VEEEGQDALEVEEEAKKALEARPEEESRRALTLLPAAFGICLGIKP
jgi:hypothetical protein